MLNLKSCRSSDEIVLKIENECLCIKLREKCPYSELLWYFPAFGLNTDRYEVLLRIQSECWKIRTSYTDYGLFYAV